MTFFIVLFSIFYHSSAQAQTTNSAEVLSRAAWLEQMESKIEEQIKTELKQRDYSIIFLDTHANAASTVSRSESIHTTISFNILTQITKNGALFGFSTSHCFEHYNCTYDFMAKASNCDAPIIAFTK